MESKFQKNLAAMRYNAGLTGKLKVDRNLLLKVVDETVEAVMVAEPSFVLFDGSIRKVNAGKIFRIGVYSRAEIQRWIDEFDASFVKFCENGPESAAPESIVSDSVPEAAEAVESPVEAEIEPVSFDKVNAPKANKSQKKPLPGVRVPVVTKKK